MDGKEYNRRRARARQAAWKELEKKHPDEFARLHDKHRALEGLEPVKAIGERVHGTRSMYVAGCRCEDCTKANREYQTPYMQLHRLGIPLKSEADAYWDD